MSLLVGALGMCQHLLCDLTCKLFQPLYTTNLDLILAFVCPNFQRLLMK